jgi:hypothetical protein
MVFAQNYSCSGLIIDSVSREPLSYVTVQLLKFPDSILYAGAITDGQGKFSIQNLVRGNYLCRISYVGYQKKDINVTFQEKRAVNLEKIELIQAQILLPEISINAQGPVNVKIDRTVYQMDSSLLSKVTTSAELLSKMPELQVNKTMETVTIKGKENSTVMINGVLLPNGAANIRSINPLDIEQVEIITAPASEYVADIDGIINIILKEKINDGVSGRVFGYWCAPPWNRTEVGMNFQYGTDKIRYTVSYWYSFDNWKSQSDTTYRESTDKGENFTIYQSREAPDKRKMHNHFIENNLEFYINKNNYLNLFTRNNVMTYSSINRFYATQKYFNHLSDTIFSLSINEENYNTGNYTLFYRKKFNKNNHRFTANFNFHHLYNTDNFQYKEAENDDSLPFSSYTRKENTKISRYSYNLKLDYYNPISKKIDFSTGALGYYQNFFNNYRDGGFSDTIYNYSTLKGHYYADIVFRLQNFALRIGNKIEGYFAYIENVSCAEQLSYLPSLAVSQKINNAHTLRFNYRAVNYYPNVWILNPYRTYSADSLTAREGNPNIKPATQHDFSLEYQYRKGITTLETNASYQYRHNDFMYESELDQQNILVYRPININGKNRFSFYVNTSFDFDFLSLSGSINPYYEHFNNRNDYRKNFSCNIDVSMEFYLPYDFGIDIYFYYYGKRFTSQGYTQYAPMLLLEITKKLFKKSVSLDIGYSGLFFPDHRITVTEQPDLYQWQQYSVNQTGFWINFRYFFQKGKEYRTERIEKYMEPDKNR